MFVFDKAPHPIIQEKKPFLLDCFKWSTQPLFHDVDLYQQVVLLHCAVDSNIYSILSRFIWIFAGMSFPIGYDSTVTSESAVILAKK